MARGECPYCGGSVEKIRARVVRQPSHLAFGYGERRYRCRKCSSEHCVCYPIPPKGCRGGMPKPHPEILKLGLLRSIGGFADPEVSTAKLPVGGRTAEKGQASDQPPGSEDRAE